MIFLFFGSSLACLEPELELFEVWEINVRQIIIIANGINSQKLSLNPPGGPKCSLHSSQVVPSGHHSDYQVATFMMSECLWFFAVDGFQCCYWGVLSEEGWWVGGPGSQIGSQMAQVAPSGANKSPCSSFWVKSSGFLKKAGIGIYKMWLQKRGNLPPWGLV